MNAIYLELFSLGRLNRVMAVPMKVPAIDWDQDHALCIQGRPYKAPASLQKREASVRNEDVRLGSAGPSPRGARSPSPPIRPRPGALAAPRQQQRVRSVSLVGFLLAYCVVISVQSGWDISRNRPPSVSEC